MEPLFEISDERELLALFEALWEAKFHPDPEKPEIQGSPFVASICHQVLDALIALEERRYRHGVAELYRSYRQPTPYSVDLIRRQLSAGPSRPWSDWSQEQKVNCLKLLFAPMLPDDKLIETLVAERDAELSHPPEPAHPS